LSGAILFEIGCAACLNQLARIASAEEIRRDSE
jgi:hypothetical protein